MSMYWYEVEWKECAMPFPCIVWYMYRRIDVCILYMQSVTQTTQYWTESKGSKWVSSLKRVIRIYFFSFSFTSKKRKGKRMKKKTRRHMLDAFASLLLIVKEFLISESEVHFGMPQEDILVYYGTSHRWVRNIHQFSSLQPSWEPER